MPGTGSLAEVQVPAREDEAGFVSSACVLLGTRLLTAPTFLGDGVTLPSNSRRRSFPHFAAW